MSSSKEKFFSYYSNPSEENQESCAHPHCTGAGTYKAFPNPRLPKNPILLCEDHIKLHNQGLNYFQGMSSEDIEQEIRADSVWRRPTWPLGTQQQKFSYYFEDPSDIQKRAQDLRSHKVSIPPPDSLPSHLREAVIVLNVTLPLSLLALKKAYKVKVKQYHPDLNKGSQEATEKFKQVGEAYKALKNYLS